MELYNQTNKKVIYTGKGGDEHDKEMGSKYLTIDEQYTVEEVVVSNFSSVVYLKEIQKIHPSGARVGFNTVMFRNIEDEESEAEYIERVKPTLPELLDHQRKEKQAKQIVDEAIKYAEGMMGHPHEYFAEHADKYLFNTIARAYGEGIQRGKEIKQEIEMKKALGQIRGTTLPLEENKSKYYFLQYEKTLLTGSKTQHDTVTKSHPFEYVHNKMIREPKWKYVLGYWTEISEADYLLHEELQKERNKAW